MFYCDEHSFKSLIQKIYEEKIDRKIKLSNPGRVVLKRLDFIRLNHSIFIFGINSVIEYQSH